MVRSPVILACLLALLAAVPVPASDLGDELDRRLHGAWAVVDVELYSNCSGTYSDNRIGAAGVASKADRRFEPGELVKIDKIKVKRSRIDLLTTMATSVLSPYTDGPFELYEVLECKVQLIFELPRELIKRDDVEGVLQAIGRAVTPYPDQRSAAESELWNGREQEPFPDDYEFTLARHQHWKAEQTNAAVAAQMDRAADEAADAADDIDRNPDYLDGFAAGAEEMRDEGPSDCSGLIDASFSTWRDSPPSGKSSAWKRGFDDGQRLVFHIELLRGLRHCYVPVPPAP